MTLKTLLLICLLYGCGDSTSRPDKCVNDTVWLAQKIIIQHDTLVYMVTTDSIKVEPRDTSFGLYIVGSGWECCSPIDGDRFKDGKTKDTIIKHEIIYYQ